MRPEKNAIKPLNLHEISTASLSFLVIIFLISFPQRSSHASEGLNSCSLFMQADAEKVLGSATGTGRGKSSMMPAGHSCRYTFKKDGNIYGIKITIATDATIEKEGFFESAADNFNRQKKTRKNHEYASTTLKQVSELGDDAFWSGSLLWVLKTDTLLIIDSDAYLAGSFKDRKEAKQARQEIDLETSLNAARIILGRLTK